MSERCARCRRRLIDPESKERGFGPVCWAKAVQVREAGRYQAKLISEPALPFKGDIVLKRSPDGAAITNVVCKEINHSPAGFEWGYGGSGPSDLALNILLMFTDKRTAEELYQAFKWDFIAKVPYDGCMIKGSEIRKWLREHRDKVS